MSLARWAVAAVAVAAVVVLLSGRGQAAVSTTMDADGHVFVYVSGADRDGVPTFTDLRGLTYPSPALVNATDAAALWASSNLPDGVYRITGAGLTPALVAVDAGSRESDVGLAEALEALGSRIAVLEARLANATKNLEGLGRDLDALNATVVREAEATRSDARSAKVAAEGLRFPTNLATEEGVEASTAHVLGAVAAGPNGNRPLEWAGLALGAVNLSGLAYLGAVRSRNPKSVADADARPAAAPHESAPLPPLHQAFLEPPPPGPSPPPGPQPPPGMPSANGHRTVSAEGAAEETAAAGAPVEDAAKPAPPADPLPSPAPSLPLVA